jgi:hypothetical protein
MSYWSNRPFTLNREGKKQSLNVFYSYMKEQPDTWDTPGNPEMIEWGSVMLHGHDVYYLLTDSEREEIENEILGSLKE